MTSGFWQCRGVPEARPEIKRLQACGMHVGRRDIEVKLLNAHRCINVRLPLIVSGQKGLSWAGPHRLGHLLTARHI